MAVYNPVEEKKTYHLMVDLETFGTKPGCIILSIGAKWFDIKSEETVKSLYLTFSLKNSLGAGYTIDANTFCWWLQQDRSTFLEATSGIDSISILDRVSTTHEFFTKYKIDKIWAKSPKFDLSILEKYISDYNLSIPWEYNQEADVRTYCMDFPYTKTFINENPHHPSADCSLQIRQVSYVYNKINNEER